MAEPLSDATQALLAAFHEAQERITRVEAERQSLAALERLIADLKTALVDPSALEAKIALNSTLDAVQILTSRFDTLLMARDAIGAADAAVAAAQGLLAGEALTAAQQLQLLSRFLGGLNDVLKIPGVGPLLGFYVKAIESIVEFVPVIEARAQEAARAADEGPDYLATGREPSAAQLEMQRSLDEQLEGIAGRAGALDAEEEAARTAAAALRTQLVAQGIEDPEHTYSTRQQEVRFVVREALEASGLLTALIALAGTPEYELPMELSDSRAARTQLDLDQGQLSTDERGELREQAAAYDRWTREQTGHSDAHQAAEAARDAAWERFTRTVREAAATGNWDESDLRSINGTLYELRDSPGWEPFREVLRWDAERDGGPGDAWRASEFSSALEDSDAVGHDFTKDPGTNTGAVAASGLLGDGGSSSEARASDADEERSRRAMAAMDRREQVGAQLDAQPD